MEQCRICLCDEMDTKSMLRPCQCSGTSAYVHRSCLDTWRKDSASAFMQCPSCKASYKFEPHTDVIVPTDVVRIRRWLMLLVVRDAFILTFTWNFLMGITTCVLYWSKIGIEDPFPNYATMAVFYTFLVIGVIVLIVAIFSGGGGAFGTGPSGSQCTVFVAVIGAFTAMVGLYMFIHMMIDERTQVLRREAVIKGKAFVVADYTDPHAVSYKDNREVSSSFSVGRWFTVCVCVAMCTMSMTMYMYSPI